MSNIISSGNEILKFNSGEVIEISEGSPIPIPTLWLSAGVGIVKDGDDKVSQWQDKSGNDYHAEQEAQANKPTWQDNALNNRPCLHFNGSSNFLTGLMDSSEHPLTIFCVWEKYNTSKAALFSNITALTHDTILVGNYGIPPNSTSLQGGSSNYVNYPKDNPFPYKLTTGVFNTALSRIYENGTLMGSGSLNNNTINEYEIGRGRINGLGYSGINVAEIIFYNSLLSDTQRQSVENYLMNKYAL